MLQPDRHDPPGADVRELWPMHDEDRRQQDHELVEHLRQSGFRGDDYEQFARMLTQYAYATLMKAIRTGDAHTLIYRSTGIFLDLVRLGEASQEDTESLVRDSIADAWPRFRENALIGGGWDVTKGANVTTYFTRACVYKFVDCYRSWARSTTDGAALVRLDDAERSTRVHPATHRNRENPEEYAVQHDEIQRAMSGLTDRDKEVLVLTAIGLPTSQIANRLRVSESTIRRTLTRVKRLGGSES